MTKYLRCMVEIPLTIIEQMMKAEGVTEAMKAANQLLWVQSMNSIRDRAEEIIKHELIYCDDAERRA